MPRRARAHQHEHGAAREPRRSGLSSSSSILRGAGESRNPRISRAPDRTRARRRRVHRRGSSRREGTRNGEGTLSKDATLFHLAPVLLSPSSVILPGNYGRIITAMGLSHPLWARENILNCPPSAFPRQTIAAERMFRVPYRTNCARLSNADGSKGRLIALANSL